jgi:energy-coupling factor transporter ATP-binding protein EcfA2/energy-coupling factor transporter transmembrane protein EcfT
MPIVVEKASAGFPDHPGLNWIRDISFTLQDQTVTLLLGKTGSGKSTLLDMLAGLRELQGGSILYDDVPLWRRKRRLNRAVNHRIGCLFQQPEKQLFAVTVEREFRYSLRFLALSKEEADSRIRQAMHALKLPEELLHRSPLQLSSGQKRRVALGTVFAAGPDWLLLDEPTAALDPDGVRMLADWLRVCKENNGCGMVIATHDLDTFLPMADRIIVLDRGSIAADLTPQELCGQPDILLRAGIGLPSSMELSLLLRAQGLDIPASCSAEEMAGAISRSLQHPERRGEKSPPCSEPAAAASDIPANGTEFRTKAWERGSPPMWMTSLDPRSKWAFLFLVSAGALLQQKWSGIAVSACIALAAMLACRYPWRRIWRMFRPFTVFIFFSALLSGLEWGGMERYWPVVRFSVSNALDTGKQLVRMFPVMLLGIWFSRTTSHLSVKKGLEKALSFLTLFRVPVDLLTLPASLTLRFIPLLTDEFERFSRIVRARGKSQAKPGAVRLGDVKAVLVPFLLSCFQLAEHLSLAIEARGYKIGGVRTSSVKLCWKGKDFAVCAAGVLLFILLASWR